MRLDFDGKAKRWLVAAFLKREALSAAEGETSAGTNRTEPAPDIPAGQEADTINVATPEDDGKQESGRQGVEPLYQSMPGTEKPVAIRTPSCTRS